MKTKSIGIALLPFALVCFGCSHENSHVAQAPPAAGTPAGEPGMTPASGENQGQDYQQQQTVPQHQNQGENQYQNENENENQSPGENEGGATGNAATPGMQQGANGEAQNGAAAQPLSDSQIDAVVTAVNQSEIQLGKTAMKKAKNPKVKRFAELMVKQHTNAQRQLDTTARQLGLTPADSQLLTQLKSDSEATTQNLSSLSGQDFDTAYIDAEVMGHQKVVDKLNNQLIPQASSPKMKDLLQNTLRPVIEAHLSKAMEIRQSLGTPGTSNGNTNNNGGMNNGSTPGTNGPGTPTP